MNILYRIIYTVHTAYTVTMAGIQKEAKPAKGAAKERKAKHTYSEEDVMLIKDCA